MNKMRKVFNFGNKKTLGHWFPRHMGKGLRQMRGVLRKVDCVIEVHDCRIPISGRNPNLAEVFSSKPSLLVLNKCDLAELSEVEKEMLHRTLMDEGTSDYMFTNCLPGEAGKLDESVKEIIPRCREIIDRDYRYDREAESTLGVMVVGVPNVGKSSLINALRRTYLGKGKGTPVGKSPGYTRSVMNEIKVCEKPIMYLHDTPGILEPRITDLHSGMKLALCNNVQDHMIGTAMIADYLLFMLNCKKQFKYVEEYHLKEPTDDIQPLLHNIAVGTKHFQRRKVITGTGKQFIGIPDYEYASNVMLQDFRRGILGRFTLDDLA